MTTNQYGITHFTSLTADVYISDALEAVAIWYMSYVNADENDTDPVPDDQDDWACAYLGTIGM